MRIWNAMRTLTDHHLKSQKAANQSKTTHKPRILKKDVGTITDKMDCDMLSASDEFFIEFELNKKFHKNIDDLR